MLDRFASLRDSLLGLVSHAGGFVEGMRQVQVPIRVEGVDGGSVLISEIVVAYVHDGLVHALGSAVFPPIFIAFLGRHSNFTVEIPLFFSLPLPKTALELCQLDLHRVQKALEERV